MAQKHRTNILARFSVSASWRGTVLKPMLIHAFSANLPSASQTDKPTIWLVYMEISCQRFRIFLPYRYSRPNDLNWSCAWFLSGGVTVSSAIGVRQIALDRDYGNCPSSNLRPQVEGAHSRCTQTQVYENHLFTQTHVHTNTGVNTDAHSGV